MNGDDWVKIIWAIVMGVCAILFVYGFFVKD